MNKKLLIIPLFLGVSSIGFSQSTSTVVDKNNPDKKSSKNLTSTPLNVGKNSYGKPKSAENTNNPVNTGAEKKIVNGKTVYVKQNNRITVVYTPKK